MSDLNKNGVCRLKNWASNLLNDKLRIAVEQAGEPREIARSTEPENDGTVDPTRERD
jgi:hypothetical protein